MHQPVELRYNAKTNEMVVAILLHGRYSFVRTLIIMFEDSQVIKVAFLHLQKCRYTSN